MRKIILGFAVFLLINPLSAQKIESTVTKELEHLSNIGLLPHYRQNSDVAMLSSYDPTGGNDDGFSGKYSYIRKEGENRLVMADLKGPGVIQRIWTPTPTTDTIAFYFDGEKKPRIKMKFGDLFSGKQFPFVAPLAGNEIGGYYNYTPIPYEKSCKIVYIGGGLKFHQIQYRTYKGKVGIQSFSMDWTEAEKKALEKVSKAWTGFHGYLSDLKANKNIQMIKKKVSIFPGQRLPLAKINTGGRVLAMTFDNAPQLEGRNTDLIFRSKWDDETAYAINAPMASLFGYAFGKSSMQSILMGTNRDTNYCYLPMPFDKKAVFELAYLKRDGASQPTINFEATIYYANEKRNPKKEGKLYTSWKRENPPKGVPYTILNQKGKGHHAGTILFCQSEEKGDVWFPTGFFEGDDVTTIDGEMRMHGTGSEDYFNGGWYGVANRWDDAFSLPLHGCLNYSVPLARTAAYRFYMGDKVNFDENYKLTIEHGATNNQWAVDYGSVAFYYGGATPIYTQTPDLDNTRAFNEPERLEVFLNFFNIQSLGHPPNPISVNYTRLNKKEVFLFHTEEDWTIVKTNLDVPVTDGIYRLYISYFKTPDSNQLCFYKRQKPISGWLDIHSDTVEFIKQQYVGELEIQNGKTSLTIKTKGEKGKCDFALHRFHLIKK